MAWIKPKPAPTSTSSGLAQSLIGDSSASGLLTMPEFNYTPSDLITKQGDMYSASDILSDYYGQFADSHLSTLDTWAAENSGKMVTYDPNAYMTPLDFGWDTDRGQLLGAGVTPGYYLNDTRHDAFVPVDHGDGGLTGTDYYTKDDRGRYQQVYNLSQVQDGTSLYKQGAANSITGEWDGNYDEAGVYRAETFDEAVGRLLEQGGGYADYDVGRQDGHSVEKWVNTRTDFFNNDVLGWLTSEQKSKFGGDVISDPELQKYIDDPTWVQRDEQGNVTAIRAELVPYVTREALGAMHREIADGLTKASNGLGDVFKMAALAAITWGVGTAASAALGVGGSTVGSAAVKGLSSAAVSGLTGGDPGKAFIGGSLGSLGSAAAGSVVDTGSQLADKAITQAVGSGLGAAATGGDVGKALVAGTASGLVSTAVKDWEPTGNANVDAAFKSGVTQGVSAAAVGNDPLMSALLGAGGTLAYSSVKDAVAAALDPTTPTAGTRTMTEQEQVIDAQQREFGGTVTDAYNQTNAGIQAGMLNNQNLGYGVGTKQELTPFEHSYMEGEEGPIKGLYNERTVLDSIENTRTPTDEVFADFAQKSTYDGANYTNDYASSFIKKLLPDLAGGTASAIINSAIIGAMTPDAKGVDVVVDGAPRRYGADPSRLNRMINGRDLTSGYVSEAVRRTRSM